MQPSHLHLQQTFDAQYCWCSRWVGLLGLLGHERKPSFSPFFFASLISPWTCFPSAPICVPKFLMTAHAKH